MSVMIGIDPHKGSHTQPAQGQRSKPSMNAQGEKLHTFDRPIPTEGVPDLHGELPEGRTIKFPRQEFPLGRDIPAWRLDPEGLFSRLLIAP
jgi:hypothetical protein